jgi:hypothetical protein
MEQPAYREGRLARSATPLQIRGAIESPQHANIPIFQPPGGGDTWSIWRSARSTRVLVTLLAVAAGVVAFYQAIFSSRGGALLHGSGLRAEPLSPERDSRHSIAVGHAEVGHRVENLARQLHLHPLSTERPTSHTSTDDRLVSVHGVFHQAALAVA